MTARMLTEARTADGGGVKGYSSLLILKALMKEIKRIEESLVPMYASSVSCPWSSRPLEPEEHDFFIHHYVDYFFGTSTGGFVRS
jgi:patatin-like phospholipase/acyl hydrolase